MNLFKTNSLLRRLAESNPWKTWIRCNTTIDISNPFERHFDDLTADSFADLIQNDDSVKSKIELILSEYEYEKYTTLRVPSTISSGAMKDLLSLDETIDRQKMIRFLFTKETERSKSLRKRKQISEKYWTQKTELWAKSKAERTGLWDEKHELVYGLWHNSLVSKIHKHSNNRLQTNRLRRAAIFGQKLVIDLDFDNHMKLYERRLLLKQINLLYNYNKYRTVEPFDLHFTNCDPDSTCMQEFSRFFPNFDSPEFMATMHRQSYLDVLPSRQLVYLSPHSSETLHVFNDDDIYIIGGLIDKSFRQPITYIKAKKEGIRTARLPLDEHMLWGIGTKSLCLNHIIAILHDIKQCGDWRRVLSHNIPQRKQKSIEEIEFEDSLRKQKFNRFNRKHKQNINI